LDNLAILHVDAADFSESAAGGTCVGDELGDDGEFLGRVDGQSWSVEGLIALAERVEVTPIGIADAGVAAGGSTGVALAAGLLVDCARVRGEGSCVVICFPDIHFVTACTVWAGSSVDIVGRWSPASGVGL